MNRTVKMAATAGLLTKDPMGKLMVPYKVDLLCVKRKSKMDATVKSSFYNTVLP